MTDPLPALRARFAVDYQLILLLCHQINEIMRMIIINLMCFGYIIGSRQENNNISIYFLMNGNIFNYSLASEQYNWNCGFWCDSAYAIPPNPPASTNTITGEPIFAQSYINAYNTAFNQSNRNSQRALYKYSKFYPTSQYINNNFIPGTFGYYEGYTPNSLNNLGSQITVNYLQDDISVYVGTPYLFVSAGSGGGSGFMYLIWIIVTYGVPYVVNVS